MKFARFLVPAVIVIASPAMAQNLVTNGGFEAGTPYETPDGWTGDGAFIADATYDEGVHSGNYAAFFGYVGSLGSISQDIVTTPGQTYNFDFWFASDGYTPNEFQAYFGANQVFESLNAPASGYALQHYVVTATSALTTITFSGRNDPAYQALDDVSVTAAVPEPATWAMMVLGFGLAGVGLRRRAKSAMRVTYA